MEFISRIGEKAKELGDKAKEATRRPTEFVELTKLKYELAKLQKVIINNKEAIGELVYRQFKGDIGLGAEIERLLQSTKKLEEDILQLEQKIEKMQPKPVICPQCNIELPADGIYCYKCGIKVANEADNKLNEQGTDKQE